MLLSSQPILPTSKLVFQVSESEEDEKTLQSITRRGVKQRAVLEKALQTGSLSAAIQLAWAEDAHHDATGACVRCGIVAGYYLQALEQLPRQQLDGRIVCSPDLLELVSQMTHMLLDHQEGRNNLLWFMPMSKRLWRLAKDLKDESEGSDFYTTISIVAPHQKAIVTVQEDVSVTRMGEEQEDHRRAIRITIYHARALLSQNKGKLDKAITYYRKCVSVPLPLNKYPLFEVQRLLRQAALAALERLAYEQHLTQEAVTSKLPKSPSVTSSTASSSSSSSSCSNAKTCACCGTEKRSMPVCAKCRSQTYCSIRCLTAHKKAHQPECK